MTQYNRKNKSITKNRPTLVTSSKNSLQDLSEPLENLDQDFQALKENESLPNMSDILSQSQNQSPRTGGSGSSGGKKPGVGGRDYKYNRLKGQLAEQVAGIGMLMYLMPKTQADGQVIMEHADSLTDKLVAVSKENEQVYKALSFLVTGTVWTSLSMEVMAIAGAILKNHGVSPMDLLKKKEADASDSVHNLSRAS
jgi:hypothetical protein